MAAGGGGTVNLGLNANSYVTIINQVNQQNNTLNQTLNQLNQTFNDFGRSAGGAAQSVDRLGGYLKALTVMSAASSISRLGSEFRQATKEAADFSRSIGLIQTITSDSGLNYEQWAEGIRKVSDALGQPLAQTSAAAYDLLSNQVTKGADTFGTLAVAGNLANLTNAKVTDSVNTLSSAINAYGYSSRDAEGLAAKLFTTVDLGRVTLSEVANTAGRVFETGKSVGVGFEEVNAGLISITQTGVKTDTAMTLLTNLFQKLLKPTKELQALYDELGVGSGDVFVKMNGLAGALDIIRQKTGGSTAALSKYFNEIRGFQAAQILMDRPEVFTQGLAEQEQALERMKKAQEVYESSPGFKAQKGMQELENALTTGLKTEILGAVLSVTEAFGGIKETMMGLYQAASMVGFGILGWRANIALAQVASAGLMTTLGPLLAPIAAGTLMAAFAQNMMNGQMIAAAAASLHDDLRASTLEALVKTEEADERGRAKSLEGLKTTLNEKQKAILAYTSEARRTLSKVGNDLDKADAPLKANLRNSVELVLKSAKDALKGLDSQLANATRNVESARDAKAGVGLKRGDALLNAAVARDNVETGGLNEGRLLQARISQLDREMEKAAASGDKAAFDEAFGRAESIIASASTATDENGNLKFQGQLTSINGLYDNQLKLLQQIEAVNLRNAEALTAQKAAMSAQVKAAEDAGEALYKLDVVDSKGGAAFESRAEFDAEAAKRRKAFDDAVAAVQANPLSGGEFRGAALLEQRRLMNMRVADLRSTYDARVENRGRAQTNREDLGRVALDETAISKAITDAIKRGTDAAVAAARATHSANEARASSVASLGTIHAEAEDTGNLLAGRADAESQRRLIAGLVRGTNEAANQGDFALAERNLKDLESFLQRLGNFDAEIMTTGDRGADGELQHKTPRSAISKARADLSLRQQAEATSTGANLAFGRITDAAPKAFDDIKAAMVKWDDLDATAEGLTTAKVNEAIAALSTAIDGVGQALDRAKGLAAGDQAVREREATVAATGRNAPAPAAIESMGDTMGAWDRLNAASATLGVDQVNEAISAMFSAIAGVGQALAEATGLASGGVEAPTAKKSSGGFAGYFSAGGEPRGIDTQLARVDPNEFIMNPQSSMRFKAQLQAMNAGWGGGGGGAASTTNVGDIHVNVQGGQSSRQTIDEIASGLRRRIRQGTIRLGR